MIFLYLNLGFTITDNEFDKIYPLYIQELSKKHWSPVEVAIRATKFLVKDANTKVLDIGSGVGKFCLIGSTISGAKFTGVEYRKHLTELTKNITRYYGVQNIRTIHANIQSIDFRDYNAFYLYNPFYENLETGAKIDNSVDLSPKNYYKYSEYVKNQLEQMPPGTRVVSFDGLKQEVPLSYKLTSTDLNGKLKYWIKKDDWTSKEEIFRENLIKQGVLRLRKLGFKNVNDHNIFDDDVYKVYFSKILASKLCNNDFTNKIIEEIREQLK